MERVRKHANPFHVRVVVGALDRAATFGREGPIEIELGSGAGGFLLARAANEPSIDFVGFEIRKPLVERAEARRIELGLKNLRFIFANGGANLPELLPPGTVSRFHVHFPDPCIKKRHHKRRMLNPDVIRRISTLLCLGGEIYAQSDVRDLAEEMSDFLKNEDSLTPTLLLDSEGKNPRPIAESTEWERHHERRGEPIYRMVFRKIRNPSGDVRPMEFRKISGVGESD